MIKISMIYFDIEHLIMIDLKSNLGEKGLYVTLVNLINIDFTNNNFLTNQGRLCRASELTKVNDSWQCINCDNLIYKYIDCLTKNNISSKDHFKHNFIESYQKVNNYSLIISGNEYQSSGYIPNKTSVYLFNNYRSDRMTNIILNFYNTIELMENIHDKKQTFIMKLTYSDLSPFYISGIVYLVLNSYNTLKSYQIEEEFN